MDRLKMGSLLLIYAVFLAIGLTYFYIHSFQDIQLINKPSDLYYIFFSADTYPYGDIVYGDERAKVTIIASMDSENKRLWMENFMPSLKKDYLDRGVVRVYIKDYNTLSDLKNDKFKYSKIISCQDSSKNEECSEMQMVLNDAIKNEFTMAGVSPVIYIGFSGKENSIIRGFPSYERLSRIILEKELMVGDIE